MKITNIMHSDMSQKDFIFRYFGVKSNWERSLQCARYLFASACSFIVLTIYCATHSVIDTESDSGLLLSLGWSFDVLIFWVVAVPIVAHAIRKVSKLESASLRFSIYSICGLLTAIFGLVTQSLIWDLDLQNTFKLAFQFVPVALLIYTSLLLLTLVNDGQEKHPSSPKSDIQSKSVSSALNQYILVSKGWREHAIAIKDISLVCSAGNYVELFSGGENYLYRSTLKSMLSKLQEYGFIQIHRKYIVRLKCIESVSGLGSQSPSVVLNDGTSLAVGKRYKKALMKMRKLEI